jgi:hypothetical protein
VIAAGGADGDAGAATQVRERDQAVTADGAEARQRDSDAVSDPLGERVELASPVGRRRRG